ncbi:Flp pilus assembly complex ATPase component TadA [Halobacillus locisalis]|uniref:Flp pilus assembly complex ATPase component TadA n=1 Tax=Halobacillus locisalis TaxID=220753 RepID=A0A838CNZ0_9BACI|nr:competence type IV pilus ATPase ComGA [Halobacillus locisalis]MBA2173613.1 Flp pilus assembly complex ATPase component TadA [Halobacillus locisalis]
MCYVNQFEYEVIVFLKSIANFARELFVSAIQQTASDIHFSPFAEHTNIYFRIHGERIFHSTLPLPLYKKLLSYFKYTSGMDIGEMKRPQNGTLQHRNDQTTFDLRLSTLPITGTESLAIRILTPMDHTPLEQLFLFPDQLKQIERWLRNKSGMILFTGPTGCGKTTTLYALLQSLMNRRSFQAITLEDPIEKNLNNIIQVQVNERAGITYDTGLKAALRHDPDLLMVGEIRDQDTAQFAFRAALSGHLVISTIHAKDAFGTIRRLHEMKIKQADMEQTLIAIAAQQLLPLEGHDLLPKRAAILELLDGELLEQSIKNESPYQSSSFRSFPTLRRKAYALGFTKASNMELEI